MISLMRKFYQTPALAPKSANARLHVEVVEVARWSEIAQVANQWQQKAQKKGAASKLNSKERSQFADCAFVCSSMKRFLSEQQERIQRTNPQNNRIVKEPELYVCRDETGEIHGIGIAQQNRSTLIGEWLSTHPRNIRCQGSLSKKKRVEGVGRAFFTHLNKLAKERGLKAIVLKSSASAEQFYLRKMGFQRFDDPTGRYGMVKYLDPKPSKL